MAPTKWSEVRRRKVQPEDEAEIRAMKEAMLLASRLAELRVGSGVTQVELAKRLGRSQASVSATERRDDVFLSTLREYVEAIGGRLEVAAVFPDRRVLLRVGEERGRRKPGPAADVA